MKGVIRLVGLLLTVLATSGLVTIMMNRTNRAQGCSRVWENTQTGEYQTPDDLPPPTTAPQGNFVPGQVIVGYRDDTEVTDLVSAARALGGVVQKTIPGPGGAILLSFPSEDLAQRAIPQLQSLPGVVFVERNEIIPLPGQPEVPVLPRGRIN